MTTEMKQLLACCPVPPCAEISWAAIGNQGLWGHIARMRETQQQPGFHDEGDVWTHTRMVCDALVRLPAWQELPQRRREETFLAALLHDVAKPQTTRLEDGRLVSPHHGPVGAQMARCLLWTVCGMSGTTDEQQFRETVCLLIRYHTAPLHALDTEDPERRMLSLAVCGEQCPDFTMHLLCLLCEADILGRVCFDREELLERLALCREAAEEYGCLHGPGAFGSACTRQAYLAGGQVWREQELYDDTWGEVVLVCGLPGTGKDAWIRANLPDLPMISLDDMRATLGVRPTDDQSPVIQRCREQAQVYLRAHRPFVWNATNVTDLIRGKQIGLFERYHARVRVVFLETGWQEELRRNRDRSATVPESAIRDMLEKLTPPDSREARRVDWICV